MAQFDEQTGERLDGPGGKWSREMSPKSDDKKPADPAQDSEPKSDDKKPAKSPKKD